MKVLILDDSKAMRLIVKRTLRQAGLRDVEVIEGTDGKEGLALVREHKPDLVISDWNMPEMNGIELLRALRSEGNSVRFGFVTTEVRSEKKWEAMEAGAEFLVSKPFSVDDLKEALAH